MRFVQISGVLLAFFMSASTALAQPTANIFDRVLMLQSQYYRGTVFSLDEDQREYWITAKHILTGAKHPPSGLIKEKTVSLLILNPGVLGDQWLSEKFSVIDPGNDVDIVVLAAQEPLLKDPLPSVATGSAGAIFGSDCDFVGFPFGAAWRATFPDGRKSWMPFTKRCTVSAFINEKEKFWVLDGLNNEGFSGGPVIFGTGAQLKILGVVSGYQPEPADVIPSTPAVQPNVKVNVNSGFF